MIAAPASTLRPIRPGRQRPGRAGDASPITSSADAASLPPGVRTQTTSESWQRSETQVTTRPVFPAGGAAQRSRGQVVDTRDDRAAKLHTHGHRFAHARTAQAAADRPGGTMDNTAL